MSSVPCARQVGITSNVQLNLDMQYEFIAVRINVIRPWNGPEIGGTMLVILGRRLQLVVGACRFGSTPNYAPGQGAVQTGASSHGSDGVRCVSPGGLPTGWTSVELSSYGVPVRSGGSFYVHARLLVSALLPATGPVAGGTRVALVGAPFGEAATLRCRFEASGATAVARFVGGAQLECAAPPSAGAGARVLEVSMNGQQFSSSGVRFTYQPAAAVSSLSPTRGAAEGGTPVTVLGSGFSAGAEAAGALLCRWNASVTPAAYVSESALVCNSTARARAAGYVALELSTNGREYTSDGVLFFLVSIAFARIFPASGPQHGGTLVTFFGGPFTVTSMLCAFGPNPPTPASSFSSSVLKCVSPPHFTTGWVDVSLLSHGTYLSSYLSFFFSSPLQSLAPAFQFGEHSLTLFPASGPSLGGTIVTLAANGLQVFSEARCRFGETESEVTARFISATSAECASPRHSPASVAVEISLNGQQFSATLDRIFQFIPSLILLSLTPHQGPTHGGMTIFISGSYFSPSSVQSSICRFQGTSSPATLITSSLVKCDAPAITRPGYVSAEVTTNLQDFTDSGFQFRFVEIVVNSVSPSLASQLGGTEVTVHGKNFIPSNEDALWCMFGADGPAVALWE